MNIEIKAIRDSGTKDKERIVLRVLKDEDIGFYVIFDTTFTEEGNISNKVRHSFWFPDKKVRAGDLVVLYTKRGQAKEREKPRGITTHFFYWGLDKTIWNEEGDCGVLLKVSNWDVKGAY
ncbi:MAG TPA: hypothetical protein VMW93_04250 [bacterium]|nr:hypothetical protein [bacterium]